MDTHTHTLTVTLPCPYCTTKYGYAVWLVAKCGRHPPPALCSVRIQPVRSLTPLREETENDGFFLLLLLAITTSHVLPSHARAVVVAVAVNGCEGWPRWQWPEMAFEGKDRNFALVFLLYLHAASSLRWCRAAPAQIRKVAQTTVTILLLLHLLQAGGRACARVLACAKIACTTCGLVWEVWEGRHRISICLSVSPYMSLEIPIRSLG